MNKVPFFPVMAIPLSQLLGLSWNSCDYTVSSLSQVSTVSLNFLSMCVFKNSFPCKPKLYRNGLLMTCFYVQY